MVESELLYALELALELLGADEFDLHPEERRRVLAWRALQFRQLGFDDVTCVALAEAPVDLGQARRLIVADCPVELAASILL